MVRANITAGSNGVNCSNYSQFRLFDGTSWTSWLSYVSNAIIPYPANTTKIEVRAWRGNCEVGAGCNATDTVSVLWNITPSPVAPIISKIPNLDNVCSGNVSASILQPGTGGSGCSDIYEYRTDNGSGYGAWMPYVPTTNIPTIGLTSVQVKAYRGNCAPSGCNNTLDTTVTWNISPAPISPSIVKNPDQASVCQGINVSGVITPGSGGSSGCADVYESRTNDGTTWSAWTNYTSAAVINTIGITNVEIRVYRLCDPLGGCTSTDTTTIAWTVSTGITMPVMNKVPDVNGVCSGTNVSATLVSAGSGGSATCEDVFNYRTQTAGIWTTWQTYVPSTQIPSVGKDSIQIQYFRGNCPEATACGPNAINTYTWFVSPQPIAPTVSRIPDVNTVCSNVSVSANITAGSGGAGCVDTYEYRTHNGTSWSAWMPYIVATSIPTSGIQQVEIHVFRGNCSAGSGCLSTAINTVSWNIAPAIVPPVLTKTPDTDELCQGNNVSAIIATAGSGGAGCSDVYEYRTNNGSGFGAWAAYVPGTIMPSVGLTSIQVISYRGNCIAGSQCVESTPDTITWNFVPSIIAPVISRIPNIDTVCTSTAISANITAGIGGSGCSDTYQFRTFNGVAWTVWSDYTSGSAIPYVANNTKVEVRAFRANCNPSSLCIASDTAIAAWVYYPENIAPIMSKIPNLDVLCEGTNVSATVSTPGSGGAGCSDVYEYRINNGSGYGAWMPYILGNNINSAGITSAQIISYRGNCNPLVSCSVPNTDTLTWTFVPQPIEPVIIRNPDVNNMCYGTLVRANITAGSNGVNCSNYSQFRLFDGTSWTSWLPYFSNAIVPYPANTTQIEVRAWRGNCEVGAGCNATDTISVMWNITPSPIAPSIVKVPDVNDLCSGNVSADLVTAGTGGAGCSDIFEYRTDNGTGYGAWLTYVPSTPISVSGLQHIQIRALRGNCDPFGCSNTSDTVLTWDVTSAPIAPSIVKNPDQLAVCQGITVSGIITPGSGGSSSCADVYESRTNNGTTWSAWTAYTSTTPLNTIGITNVEIRVYRLCNPIGGCTSTDTTTIAWSVSTDITMPVMNKIPDISGVCSGTNVSADLVSAGSGGSATCEDVIQYRTYSTGIWTAWQTYIPSTQISSVGVDSVQIQYFRGNCPEAAACGPNAVNTFTWFVSPQPVIPTIVRVPDVNSVCESVSVSAVITPGTGGAGCTDTYEYRTFDGLTWTAWMPYVSATPISPIGIQQIEIQVYRGNCNVGSGCIPTAVNTVSWNISPAIIPPVMARIPDVDALCQGNNVSAVVATSGTGGAGCNDVYEYRTNNGTGYGAWTAYVSGAQISSIGMTSIQVIGSRINCDPLANCPAVAPDTLTWTFSPQPSDPTIVKTPNVNAVCNGTVISAQITTGANGVGCSDVSEYRLFDGAIWSAWTPYSSMTTIPYDALTQTVEVRSYRGDCDPSSLCTSSNIITAQWNITPSPIAPSIVKVPDVNDLCSGNVSADLVTAGTGGAGCSDIFEYRIDNGTGYGAWLTYVPSTPISVSGLQNIQIRALRGNCDPFGCNNTSDTTLTWNVTPAPISPIIVKNPDQLAVCQGITVSGVITPGSGGSTSCADVYESRTNDGTTWSAWTNYTSTTPINTVGITNVEIRVYRLCDPSGGCTSTDTTTVAWSVSTDITMPVMAKVPDVAGVCEGYFVSANIVTPGSGGSATCEDVFQYRTNNAGVWTAWQNYIPTANISTSGADSVQIQYFRGNCPEATACGPNAVNTFTWEVLPQLTAPIVNRIPDQDAVCEGALLTGVASGSTGGVGPIDYEYQNLNPGSWTWNNGNSFVPDNYGMAYIRARAVSSVVGCENSDWEWVSWVVERRPDVSVTGNATICQGANATLNATAEDGFGVANVQWQYSTDGCSGPWTNYDTIVNTATPFTTPNLNQTTYFQAVVFQAGSSCQTVSSCITVNVNPAPIASITGVIAVCESSNAVLVASVVNPPASITYQWQQANSNSGPWFITGTNNDSLSIVSATQPKWYRLIVLNNGLGCNDTSDVVQVQNGTSPVISAISSDISVCENGSTVLSVSASSFPSPSYQWYGPAGLIAGSTSDTLMLNGLQLADEGNYYVAITNPCGTINSANIFVDMINNMTHPTAITGTSVRCQGDGTDLYVTNGSGILATNWTINPVEAGMINPINGFVTWDTAYSGTATISTQAFGCNDTSAVISLDVIVNPTVQAPVISGTNVRCVGPGSDTYIANAVGGTSYVWSISNAGWSTIDNNGVVTWDPAFTGTAVIYAYAQGCNGPSGYSNFLVYAYDTIYYTHSGNVNVCENGEASIWISPIPPVGNTYQWYDNQGEIIGANDTSLIIPNVQLSDTNTYYCRIISYCGDTLYTAVDSLIIRPTPEAAFNAIGTCRFDTIFFTNTSTIESGSLGFIWNFGDGNMNTDVNPNHIYINAGSFDVRLTAISEWGCENTVIKPVVIRDLPTAQLISIGDSCSGNSNGSLTVVPQTGDYPFTYSLNNGTPQNDSLFANLPAGAYTIVIEDGNGCSNRLYGEVTQPHTLLTNIYPQHSLCYNDTSAIATLEVIGGTEPYLVVWSNGDTAQNLMNVPSGYYTVDIIDSKGCTATDSVTIYQPNPMYVDSLVIPPTCLERNDGKIFVYVSGGTGNYDYLWSNTSIQDSITNLSSGMYYVTVTDAHGCTQIKGYNLETPPNNCLTIWTSYSPDGDGINDVWNIGGIDLYPDCKVEIFNRWGYKIYESKGYDTPWDGMWNGKELPAETYYFAITLGDGSKPITGTVTIIR